VLQILLAGYCALGYSLCCGQRLLANWLLVMKRDLRGNWWIKVFSLEIPIYVGAGRPVSLLSTTIITGIEEIDAYFSRYLPQLFNVAVARTPDDFFIERLGTSPRLQYFGDSAVVGVFMIPNRRKREAELLTKRSMGQSCLI